jgi:hypothetical protein
MPRIGFSVLDYVRHGISGRLQVNFSADDRRTHQDVIQTGFSQTTNLNPNLDNGCISSRRCQPFPSGFLLLPLVPLAD